MDNPKNTEITDNLIIDNPEHEHKSPSRLMFILGGIMLLFIGLVIGYYFSLSSKAKTSYQTTPSPIPSPEASDEMDGWKTYTNQKYKFEFRYPNEYQIDDQDFKLLDEENQFNQKNLCFSPYESLYITQTKFAPRTQDPQLRLHIVTSRREINEIIRDCYSDELKSWKAYLAERPDLFPKDSNPDGPDILAQINTTVNAFPAIRVFRKIIPTTPNFFETQYYFSNKGIIYIATASSNSATEKSGDVSEEARVLDQILSTFKFTSPEKIETKVVSPTPVLNTIKHTTIPDW